MSMRTSACGGSWKRKFRRSPSPVASCACALQGCFLLMEAPGPIWCSCRRTNSALLFSRGELWQNEVAAHGVDHVIRIMMAPRLRGACAVPRASHSLATRALSFTAALYMSESARDPSIERTRWSSEGKRLRMTGAVRNEVGRRPHQRPVAEKEMRRGTMTGTCMSSRKTCCLIVYTCRQSGAQNLRAHAGLRFRGNTTCCNTICSRSRGRRFLGGRLPGALRRHVVWRCLACSSRN